MSISSIHAHKFYQEVAKMKKVWTIKDNGGFPAPKNSSGTRSQPFWSSKSRVEKIIQNVSAYNSFEPYEIDLDIFIERWLVGLQKDEILIGVKWSGERATGYDIDSKTVKEAIEHQIKI